MTGPPGLSWSRDGRCGLLCEDRDQCLRPTRRDDPVRCRVQRVPHLDADRGADPRPQAQVRAGVERWSELASGRLAIQHVHRTEQVEGDMGGTRTELAIRHLDARCGSEAQHEADDKSHSADAERETEPDGDERKRKHAGKANCHDPHPGPRSEPFGEDR